MTLPLQNKVFLLSRRWAHHSSHSGYDILGNHIGTVLSSHAVPNWILGDRLFYAMTKNMTGYDRVGLALELLALRHMASHKRCVYHFLYGENTCNYIGHFNGWRGHRVVATYHKPPKYFEDKIRKTNSIEKLSSVFLVGRNQYDSFAGVVPDDHLYYLPHPVDTSFFLPPRDFRERKTNLCLFVGAHLRDYETLRAVIENAWIKAPQIKFIVVAYPPMRGEFKGLVGNYEIVSGISEAELLHLYRIATLLVMPLQETTANNTVLEAMSCGLPIIVTDIGAIRDYTSDDCAAFVHPYDPDEMLDAILLVLKSDRKRRDMSNNARDLVLRFDWREIVCSYESIYTEILSGDLRI
ncbi:MAG: glycosyltransferase family 4 protein [Spirochaetota bacterium]